MNGTLDFGTYTYYRSKTIKENVSKVNELSDKYKDISDEEFINITNEFRRRLRNGESIEDIMVEALAVAKEAIKRILKKTPYDVQLEAAFAMLGDIIGTKEENGQIENVHGKVIAEMKTGEGKTLVQILIAYLNLLEATKDEDKSKWKSVHIMTANDALAERDAISNGRVFNLLGFSSGFVPERKAITSKEQLEKIKKQKQELYSRDVVYATATTIAFDYLDSNMVMNPADRYINREFGYAIVDEADDILLDKASTPLIITGSPDETSDSVIDDAELQEKFKQELYRWATSLLEEKGSIATVYDQFFENKDVEAKRGYIYYRNNREIKFSESFELKIKTKFKRFFKEYIDSMNPCSFKNRLLELFNEKNEDGEEMISIYSYIIEVISNCIIAKHSILRDKDYKIVVDDKKVASVMLIDSNTGRVLEKTRYSNGLHDAVEAKEYLRITKEESGIKAFRYSPGTDIKAKCTYSDFLSLYKGNVSGMTGTSDEKEFSSLYGFNTYYVPTREPSIRYDQPNEWYRDEDSKIDAIIREIQACVITGQPVLVGTSSDSESVKISKRLEELHIRHQLLNTGSIKEENEIIKNAGLLGAVTVATNMAGRGVDIELAPGVRELGGLYVIGTTRNKSKRIDRQLRGRSGRQGDPGISKYFGSLDDEMVRDHFKFGILKKLKGSDIRFDKNGKITAKGLIREAERSQLRRESIDKLGRKTIEEFNKTYTEQKNIIYENRNKVLEMDTKEIIEYLKRYIERYAQLIIESPTDFLKIDLGYVIDTSNLYSNNKKRYFNNIVAALFNKLDEVVSNANFDEFANDMHQQMLKIIDRNWHEYMQFLEDFESTFLAAPSTLEDYKSKANNLFVNELIRKIYNEIIIYALSYDKQKVVKKEKSK